MLDKELQRNGTALVRFRLPTEITAEQVFLVGEFNDWCSVANEMTHDEIGFVTSIVVPVGRAYRFRYLLDGERWVNDWAADAYVPNDFGGDDSVVDVTDLGPPRVDQPTTRRPARRAKATTTR